MAYPTMHRFLAANDVLTGDIVYLGHDGGWTRDPARALRIEDETTGDLHLLDAEARGHEVTAPRLAEAL
ncbi:MAG: DUF2849 domain-containing protein [Roseicyclus sp.]